MVKLRKNFSGCDLMLEEIKKESPPSKKRAMFIIAILGLLIGAITIGYGIWQAYERVQFRAEGIPVTATINGIQHRSNVQDPRTSVFFMFEGEQRNMWSYDLGASSNWEVGDQIPIYVLSKDRLTLRTYNWVHRGWLLETIIVASGVIFLGFTCMAVRGKTARYQQKKENRIAKRKHIYVLKPHSLLKIYLLTILIGGLALALWGFISNVHHEAFAIWWQLLAGVGILALMYLLYANFCAHFNMRIYLHHDHFVFRDISGNSWEISYKKGCKIGIFLPNYNGKPVVRIFLGAEIEVDHEVENLRDIVNLENAIKDYRSRSNFENIPSFELEGRNENEVIVPRAYSWKWVGITLLLTLILIAGIWWIVHIREVPQDSSLYEEFETSVMNFEPDHEIQVKI